MSTKDYLASVTVEAGDREDAGVKGMKWGVRRSSADLKVAAVHRENHIQKAITAPAHETSHQRYSRIAQAAKDGHGKHLSDEDLKFFNNRTDALKKVNALNTKNAGWLKKTTHTVLQKAAQQQMQSITDAVATKYIGAPIVDAIGKHVGKEALAAAAKAAANTAP